MILPVNFPHRRTIFINDSYMSLRNCANLAITISSSYICTLNGVASMSQQSILQTWYQAPESVDSRCDNLGYTFKICQLKNWKFFKEPSRSSVWRGKSEICDWSYSRPSKSRICIFEDFNEGCSRCCFAVHDRISTSGESIESPKMVKTALGSHSLLRCHPGCFGATPPGICCSILGLYKISHCS